MKQDPIEVLRKISVLFFAPIEEIWRGLVARIVPWHWCGLWSLFAALLAVTGLDKFLFHKASIFYLYPSGPIIFKIYLIALATMGFWIWAWVQVRNRFVKLKKLTAAFRGAGFVSPTGRIPNFIRDRSLDPMTRKLTVTNAGFPLQTFQAKQKTVESEMGIFIDDIKENRERRTVDFIYSHHPMPSEIFFDANHVERPFEIVVGRTRAQMIRSTFLDNPHLLVAGQTGGGKSTFLRQLILSLHLLKASTKFLLIDLKGGLEFSLFDRRPGFTVVPGVAQAIAQLLLINRIIDERMKFLKENQSKDLLEYFKKSGKPAKAINLDRHFIVVDEAAEMFLAGQHANVKDVQAARGILSRVARQGRAIGIHLVVATQRPDSKSLDPQIKANLTGVLCFQMMNDSSSIAVLGNGRATDLPRIPGRAIWKSGMDMIEVQTPFLSVEDAESLLPKQVEEVAKPMPQDQGNHHRQQNAAADVKNLKGTQVD